MTATLDVATSCEVCGGRGIVVASWIDAEPDFVVCLCAAGQIYRATRNATRLCVPLYVVWAAQNGLPRERMLLLEDVLEPSEIAAMVKQRPLEQDAVIEAGRTKRIRL